jgi:hypothetical protein
MGLSVAVLPLVPAAERRYVMRSREPRIEHQSSGVERVVPRFEGSISRRATEQRGPVFPNTCPSARLAA